MAIWNNPYGQNGFFIERQLSKEDYLEILNDIQLDEIAIIDGLIEMEGVKAKEVSEKNQGVEERIKESINRLRKIRRHFLSGKKSKWENINDIFFTNKLCFFDEYHGVRMHIRNDIISIFGPWGIFANNYNFQKVISVRARDYYHIYFNNILKSFKSDFILYALEWYGIGDSDSETKNIADLLALENWKEKSSESIHSMEHVYFEYLK